MCTYVYYHHHYYYHRHHQHSTTTPPPFGNYEELLQTVVCLTLPTFLPISLIYVCVLFVQELQKLKNHSLIYARRNSPHRHLHN
uniref:Uncharacterized protein n=1 Tax=Glossina brevipalpis TaxID=37001 RepID=A0A1A9WFF9_9MUSC